jgi:hypothetical protein
MYLQQNFICWASQPSVNTGLWTQYIQNGTTRKLVKNNKQSLYRLQLFGALKSFKIYLHLTDITMSLPKLLHTIPQLHSNTQDQHSTDNNLWKNTAIHNNITINWKILLFLTKHILNTKQHMHVIMWSISFEVLDAFQRQSSVAEER